MPAVPEAYRPGLNSARLDVTSASASVSLPGGPGNTIEVTNFGTNSCYVVTGVGAQTAVFPATGSAGAGQGVAANSRARYRIGHGHDTLAAICLATQTCTITVNRGDGI